METQPQPPPPSRIIHLSGVIKPLATAAAAAGRVTDFRSVKQAAAASGLVDNEGAGAEGSGLVVFGHGHDAPLPPLQQQKQQQEQDKPLSKKRARQQQQQLQQQTIDAADDVDRYAE